MAKNAKLVGAANAQRLNNRSNVVTVASKYWTGQADYFCDGTDDEVEIQAAVDYIYSLGGGKILLTAGTFYVEEIGTISLASSNVGYSMVLKSNIEIEGAGNSTVIQYNFNTATGSYCFYCEEDAIGISLRSFYYKGYVFDNDISMLWSGLAISVSLVNVNSSDYILLNRGNASTFVSRGADCTITNCNAYGIRGDYLNISSCKLSFLRLYGYCNVSACEITGDTEYGVFIDYSYNTVSSCNIDSDLIAVWFNYGSSYNIVSSCNTGSITDNGTGNVKVNNV